MLQTRAFRTSSFRLALFYTALFGVSGLALLGFIFWTTVAALDRETNAAIREEMADLVTLYRERGPNVLIAVIAQRSAGSPGRRNIYLLTTANLVPLAGNLDKWPAARPGQDAWLDFLIEDQRLAGGGSQIARARALVLPGGLRFLVGRDMTERSQFRETMENSLIGALSIALLLGLGGGLLTSRNLLRRVDAINRTCSNILAGKLDRRVPVSGAGDEFDNLAHNINAMLDQIQRLIAGMRDVTDNVAHELKSPLTRLRSRLEVALLGRPDEGQCRELLQETIADTETMLSTFDGLLRIAQIESGAGVEAMHAVDLAELAGGVGELFQPAAEERNLDLVTELEPGLAVQGHRHLLAQALSNLLDNAIKYAASGGRVALIARRADGRAQLVVADHGPGIPASARERAVDRFVRLEGAGEAEGTGLGLSLVKAVAELHDARLRLDDNHPGLRVTLELPLSGG